MSHIHDSFMAQPKLSQISQIDFHFMTSLKQHGLYLMYYRWFLKCSCVVQRSVKELVIKLFNVNCLSLSENPLNKHYRLQSLMEKVKDVNSFYNAVQAHRRESVHLRHLSLHCRNMFYTLYDLACICKGIILQWGTLGSSLHLKIPNASVMPMCLIELLNISFMINQQYF